MWRTTTGMPDNFENPKKQKSPVEKGDYSFYRDQYEIEEKKMAELSRIIKQREKFVLQEKDPEKSAKIRAEVADLKKQEEEAADRANLARIEQYLSTKEFDRMDDGGKAH